MVILIKLVVCRGISRVVCATQAEWQKLTLNPYPQVYKRQVYDPELFEDLKTRPIVPVSLQERHDMAHVIHV